MPPYRAFAVSWESGTIYSEMKFIFKILILNFLSQLLSAQQEIPIIEIENKLGEHPRPVVIGFYTGWCGICAIQEKKIQKEEALVQLLENEFYYVKFDAEYAESFELNGYLFENPDGHIHEFAKVLLEEKIVFPSWIILNPDLETIFQYRGLLEAGELYSVLKQIL